MNKTCTKCGVTKDADLDFYKRNPRHTGYVPNSWCKVCDKAANRLRNEKARRALAYVEANGIEV